MPAPARLHPTLARVVCQMETRQLPLSQGYLRGWAARHREPLNRALGDALGPRLRLVECFAGIGGLGSGLERALNALTILQAEAEAPRRRVLARRFPLALQLPDVRDLLTLNAPDDPDRLILAGGFPCRGASKANLTGPIGMCHPRTGLWSVMADAARRWRPLALCWENVATLRTRGLDRVLADLDAAGYDALWGTMVASDFGAPHQRARLFCVAHRRGAAPILITPRAPLPEWQPWGEDLPANDADAPGLAPRDKALGDAVLPIVAWALGRTAGEVLGGWWPEGGKAHRGDHPPMNGTLVRGRFYALPESPFRPHPFPGSPQRFVTVDEAIESGGYVSNRVTAPMVGRVLYDDGEQVDVELPGGIIEPFPAAWTRPLWPTPTSNDGRSRGPRSQWRRKSPGLNVLAQGSHCPREDWAVGEEVFVQMFAGQGVGPGFLEWTMGFPRGWTEEIAQGGEEDGGACAPEHANDWKEVG